MKNWKFDFGPGGEAANGYVKINESSSYDPQTGFGFLEEAQVTCKNRGEGGELRQDFCIPVDATFRVDVPNGNYTVSICLGDALVPTRTTLRAGSGRMIFRNKHTSAGLFIWEKFAVNVRDGCLKLSFSGPAPRVNALEIAATPNSMTLFLAGDSTVTDETPAKFPYAGWGQMMSLYLKHDVAVANHAVSGRSSKSFIDEGRLDPILEEIKAGDYLFIQFGHNDEKDDPKRHTDPESTYPEHLKQYIDGARAKQATPVLITSVHRRFFDAEGRLQDTHGAYLEAVRALAKQEQIALIDLAEKSKELFEALGDEGTKELFMWGAPGEFLNFPAGVEDNTHFQERGAVRIAELVAREIKAQKLWPLFLYIKDI